MRVFAVVILALAVAGPAAAAQARLTEKQATAIFLRNEKVADWLDRYPAKGTVDDATFDAKTGLWSIHVWSGPAGEIATGKVADASGRVTEAWTGPQVAWKMARGSPGAFGGKTINRVPVWLAICAVFRRGLVDWGRPLSVRTLDLLVLLSFSVSLWFFNKGDVFTSMPLVYPAFAYLLARMVWIGVRGRGPSRRAALWPVWLLAAATVFLTGFRIGLNLHGSNVIDVGYAGVIGAHRIVHGEMPYGHMPTQGTLRACGPADAEGEIRDRIQTNGRCESSNDRGDTYGPVSYEAYVPGYLLLGWSGRWAKLPAAHFTTLAFDRVALLGLALVGRRFGGLPLAVTLAFAWAAYPFTQYVSNSNTNDAIMPAFLIWGFWLCTSAWARGAAVAFASWTKFGALLVAPLWATYPEFRRSRRTAIVFAASFAVATAACFWVLLLEPTPLHAARVFWDRTIPPQVNRHSPFSLWDWGQYHAGLPDLAWLQKVLEALLVAGAVAVAFVPRRKSPLQLAALTGALLIGFELVLTHWFYLYLPWFFAFAAFAVLAAQPESETAPATAPNEHPARELVTAG